VTDTSYNPCIYSWRKYSMVDHRDKTVVFTVDLAEIRKMNIILSINKLSGFAPPCRCPNCDQDTSIQP